MTAKARATLKGVFEQGDVPQGTDYEDLIDSFVNLTDTTAQSMNSTLSMTKAITPEVSAGDVNATGIVSASAANILGTVSANIVDASSGVFSADISAQTIGASALTVTVSASIGALNCTSLRVNTAATAAATVGAGEATPASVVGYLIVNVNGTNRAIPLYTVE